MVDFIKSLNAPGDGVIIATGEKVAPQYAALANGTFAHSLEQDDVNNEASLHPAVAIFPAALIAVQASKGTAADFLVGAIIGYEVNIRLGKALGAINHYDRGFHPTGTCGCFGATATAAKILGLSEEETVNAFGIAGSMTSASMEFLATGAWTKRMHPGWAAHSGYLAAMLAKKGFTGPATIFEGKFGFLRSYSDDPNIALVTDKLGEDYEVMHTSIKPHSCCRYKQAPIDGILQIMRNNNLSSDDIALIKIGMLKASLNIVVVPEELKYRPKSDVDAQFSMPFGAAVAALRGKASLAEYTQEYVDSPEVIEFMQKVKCIHDPELDKTFPRQWRANVVIETKDGRQLKTEIDYPKGDPENPLTWDELIAKFCSLTAPIYTTDRQQEIVNAVRSLGPDDTLTTLLQLVSDRNLGK
jgi:2-methylcitrate dehydratase PrpD